MTTFEKTSWSWQLAQAMQRLSEWLQAKWHFSGPDWSVAPWLTALITNVLWLLLAVVVGWLLFKLGRYVYERQRGRRMRAGTPMVAPAKVLSVAELLALAHYNQQQADYSTACRYLYLALLQRLHETQLIPHQISRTDREYLSLLQALSALPEADVLEGEVLLRTHEQLQFAERPISAQVFARCQAAYEHVDRQLQARQASV